MTPRLLSWTLLASLHASLAAAQTPQPDYSASNYPMPAEPRPPTPPPPPPPPREPHWAGSAVLAGSLGLGSPYGHVGLWLGHQPTRNLQVEFGGGYSASFGFAIGGMARAGLFPAATSFLSLGVGVSTNFTSFDYVTNCTFSDGTIDQCTPPSAMRRAQGTANPFWLNVEVAEDLRRALRFGVRFAVGVGVLMNTEVFPTARGCDTTSGGASPCGAGIASDRGDTYWTFYARLDLYGIFSQDP